MKRIRNALYVALFLSVIASIALIMSLLKDESVYMKKQEAVANFSSHFYQETADLLESVGKIAEFYDEYDNEDAILENTEDVTVGQIILAYENDKGCYEQCKYRLDNIFTYSYYNPESKIGYYDEEKQEIFEYGASYVDKYGYRSYSDYEKEVNKLTAAYNFLTEYRKIVSYKQNLSAKNISNLEFSIEYTKQDGEKVVYKSDYGDEILKNSQKYKSYFIYDKLNNTTIMENLNKGEAQFNSLVYKCKTFTDYNDFNAVFAVNSDYQYEDDFSYFDSVVISEPKQIVQYNLFILLLIISILLELGIIITLVLLTGMTESRQTIKIYLFDKCWWDILGVMLCVGLVLIYKVLRKAGVIQFYSSYDHVYLGTLLFIGIALCVLYVLSIARRLKSHMFWSTSLMCCILNKTSVILKNFFVNMNVARKTLAILVLFLSATLSTCYCFSLGFTNNNRMYQLLWFAHISLFSITILTLFWRYISEYSKISEKTQRIIEGNLEYSIDFPIVFKSNKKMAAAINSISEGISIAVAENVKNERLKSDLITNVSHDIKTPLTSIINYVNLLKMESIDNDKIKKYIDVLEDKSTRLKILTDDLVEASKLSSGVIKLEFEKVNVVELIRQSAAEFEEKFQEKNLELIMDIPMYPVYVLADGRKLWRVIENIFVNVYKYALEGTRVYFELKIVGKNILMTLKNISKSALNCDSSELTERFIRGDISRSTEGSGLGLSIAKSIIDRHNGEFKIIFDGDLFKVSILLNAYTEDD